MIRTTRTTRALVAALLAGAGACAAPESSNLRFPSGEVVDLSHSYGEETIYWPTSETFRLETVADGMTAHPTLSEAIKEAGLVALGRAIHIPNRKRAAAKT